VIAARDQQFLPTASQRATLKRSMGCRKRTTWPAGKWVHPALCSTPPPKKSRRVDGPGGNPTHPCVLSPQVMNGTGTRRQFILKGRSAKLPGGLWLLGLRRREGSMMNSRRGRSRSDTAR